MFQFEVSWITEEEGEQVIREAWHSDHLSHNDDHNLSARLNNC